MTMEKSGGADRTRVVPITQGGILVNRWGQCNRISRLLGGAAVSNRMKCGGNHSWVPRRDTEQGQRRPIRRAASLFPVAQGCDTDANHKGKLGLGRPELIADSLHVGWAKDSRPRWLEGAAVYTPSLSNTREQFFERSIFHGNSSRTSRPSILACAAVRSLCSFFAYRYSM